MAIEALSGSMYQGVGKSIEKPRIETTGQEVSAATINITEVATKAVKSNPAGMEQNKGQKDPSATDEQIRDAVTKMNSKLKSHRTRCEFSYHEETKRVSIKVIDKETEEIIREIPPEETLEMVEKMWELTGFLVDEKR